MDCILVVVEDLLAEDKTDGLNSRVGRMENISRSWMCFYNPSKANLKAISMTAAEVDPLSPSG